MKRLVIVHRGSSHRCGNGQSNLRQRCSRELNLHQSWSGHPGDKAALNASNRERRLSWRFRLKHRAVPYQLNWAARPDCCSRTVKLGRTRTSRCNAEPCCRSFGPATVPPGTGQLSEVAYSWLSWTAAASCSQLPIDRGSRLWIDVG